MRKATSLLVISCLLSYSMAVTGSIKNRLGEISRTNLAEVEASNCTLEALAAPSLAFCDCNLSQGALPISGSAQFNTFNQAAETVTGQTVT